MNSEYDLSFLENATETLRAIAHPARIAIIELLYQQDQMTVTQIYEKLKIEQAVASHHLRILKGKQVVTVQRSGKNSYYALAHEGFYQIISILTATISTKA